MASVNPQVASGHEAASIADEEDAGASVFVWVAELAQHILRGPVAASLGVLLEESLHHLSHDIARRNGVDADAVGTPFRGEVAGELKDSGLRRIVCGTDQALPGNVSSGVSCQDLNLVKRTHPIGHCAGH